jgi:outer membrane protein
VHYCRDICILPASPEKSDRLLANGMKYLRLRRYGPSLFCALLLAMGGQGRADDLISVYKLALLSDPQYQAAIEAHNAALEVVPQARAALLPNIGIGGDVSRDRFDPRNDADTSYATNQTYSIGLRQTLYQRESFIQLKQADNLVAQADARLIAAQQDLILRAATRYFLVLGGHDNVEFVQADKDAIARTLDQAQQRFAVGLAPITDTLEAQARYDIAVSNEINARQLLADTEEALRELTGELPVAPEILRPEIPLLKPDPANQDEWVAAAVEQNPLILASQAAAAVAKQEIQVKNSGHYPSLDAIADYSYLDNQFGGVLPLERNDASIGLELNIPLYQGGLVSSQTRQSRYEYNQAREDLVKQRRATERQTRDNYRGVLAGISKVEALQHAVLSNEKAVEAAEAGFEVGTRAIIDVLNAQRDLLAARRDYARSRYDYLLDTLELKQATGILSATDLAQVNDLLIEISQYVTPAASKRSQTAPQAALFPTSLDKQTGTAVKQEPLPATKPLATPVVQDVATPTRTAEPVIVQTGPWVINLLSLTDKAHVDKAMADTQSKGFDVVVKSATIKGRQYWRLQAPGFATLAEAQTAAEPIKEQLKIKDVWIFKR